MHAADLHLGSPLLGLSLKDEAVARRFAEASRAALVALVDEAISAKVAFLLIAGDVYDGEWRDATTGLFFAQQMSRLAREGIPVFLIKGNHDADSVVTKDITLPANVTVFSSRSVETKALEQWRVALHGRSFPKQAVTDNWALDYPQAKTGWLNIGLLHTSCDGRPGHDSYAPCSVQDLASRGYDYWALGHVHEHEILSRDPWIVYPGNIQGRSIRECGAKGAVLVRVEDGRIADVTRVLTDHARWSEVSFDVSGLESDAAIFAALETAFEPVARAAEGRLVAARLRLTGRTALHHRLVALRERLIDEAQAAAHRVAEDIWIEKVRIETHAPEALAPPDLVGLDLGALVAGLDDAELRAELARLAGDVEAKQGHASLALASEDMTAIMAEARALLLGRAGGPF